MAQERINTVKYGENEINYIVERRKIKNIYIVIKEDKVIVKMPLRLKVEYANELVEKKKKWIYESIQKQIKKNDRTIDLAKKDYLYILDKKVYIKYEYKNIGKIGVILNENTCNIIIPNKLRQDKNLLEKIEKALDVKIKELASVYIQKAMKKYSDITKLYPQKIGVRKYKRIWGNCSSKRVININQNVIWFSQDVIEYVCLHELTHLKYMNHQKEFWNYIKKYMPDYKERESKLKK